MDHSDQAGQSEIGIVAEERDDPGDEADCGRTGIVLPVENRAFVHPEPQRNLLLKQLQFAPALLQMLSERFGFVGVWLWFQCLKRERAEWQEGNARAPLQFWQRGCGMTVWRQA